MQTRDITVEGESLKACRTKAAKELGVERTELRAHVLQYGKQGLFSNKPYRVRYFVPAVSAGPDGAGSASSGASDKIDLVLGMIQVDLDQLRHLDNEAEDVAFDELLTRYDDLDEDLRSEVKELADFMAGVGGREAREVMEAVSRDGQCEITVGEDRMQAFLRVTPPEGKGSAVTLSDVVEGLQAKGIRQGVDPTAIRQALDTCEADKAPVEGVVIARGIAPKPGRNGRLELGFSRQGKEVVVDEHDRADYRGRAHIAQVKAGDLLLRIHPPTAGTPGMDVHGTEIPAAPGEPVSVTSGPNTEWREEHLALYATLDGVAEVKSGQVYVRPLFLVEGDVDMKTGNVEFDGEVEVRGNVRDHFSVRARGDVTIHGRVEGAEVVSREGSITVRQGVVGHGRCYISAGASLHAKYLEQATVYAGRDVTVGQAILNCKVVAGGAVRVEHGKGMIAGGETFASEAITVKYLGNVNEPPTRVVLGIALEDYRRIEAIDQQIASLQHMLGKIDFLMEQITNLSRDLSALPLKKRQEFVLLKKQTILSRAKMKRLLQERERLEAQSGGEGHGVLTVQHSLYGKVDVEMAGRVYRNENECGRVVLVYDAKRREIVVRGRTGA